MENRSSDCKFVGGPRDGMSYKIADRFDFVVFREYCPKPVAPMAHLYSRAPKENVFVYSYTTPADWLDANELLPRRQGENMPAKENGVSNNRGVYIGAYLEIRVIQHATVSPLKRCAGGHEAASGLYCRQCGQPMEPVIEQAYPVTVDDLLPRGSSLAEDLAEITPYPMYGEGVILAIGNDSQRANGEWFRFDCRSDAEAVTVLPTAYEVEQMLLAFVKDYNDVILALKASPLVSAVSALFGIVPFSEY